MNRFMKACCLFRLSMQAKFTEISINFYIGIKDDLLTMMGKNTYHDGQKHFDR